MSATIINESEFFEQEVRRLRALLDKECQQHWKSPQVNATVEEWSQNLTEDALAFHMDDSTACSRFFGAIVDINNQSHAYGLIGLNYHAYAKTVNPFDGLESISPEVQIERERRANMLFVAVYNEEGNRINDSWCELPGDWETDLRQERTRELIRKYLDEKEQERVAARDASDEKKRSELESIISADPANKAKYIQDPTFLYRYKMWRVISEDDRQYLLSNCFVKMGEPEFVQVSGDEDAPWVLKYPRVERCTPENDPLEFAPQEMRLSAVGRAQLNAHVDSFVAKYGRLPRGVTHWNDPRPTDAQIISPATQQESLSELIVVRADSVELKTIKWLWNNRIPMNKLSVLAGNPDQGKSLVSLYMVAQVTRGLPMYGDTRPASPSEVLIMAAEDEADDTIVPRLKAVKADVSKVHLLSSVMQKSPKKVSEDREAQMDRDLAVVERFLTANPNVRMIVIDPISSFLGRVNMNREQEVRSVLTPLKSLASRAGVAIVLIMHLNKVSDQSAIHRIGGAVAFTGVARAVWLFMQDETDKDKHLMLRVKNNIARPTGGLVFNICTEHVDVGGEQVSQPMVKWVGETESSASDLLIGKQAGRPKEKSTSAKEWLSSFLANGPETAADVEAFGKRDGHSLGTLQRAKKELGVTALQRDRKWYWELQKKIE